MVKADSPGSDKADKEPSAKDGEDSKDEEEEKDEEEDKASPELTKSKRSSSRKRGAAVDSNKKQSDEAVVDNETSSAASKEQPDSEDPDDKDDEEDENDEEDADEEVAATNKGKNSKKSSKASSKKRKASPSTLRDRRERKAVKSYSPVEPKPTDQKSVVEKGRGVRLADLDHVKEAIQAAALDDLALGYRFLFWKGRGKFPKMAKKDLKHSILAFTGYLPERDPKLSKAQQAEVDEEFEIKMGQKAYKLMVNQLKKLCDTFGIDRRGMSGNKEDLVNCLLDFLGEPVTMDKFEKIRSTSTASKKKKKEEEKNDDDAAGDDYWEDAMVVDGAEVTDETLRLWVRAFVRCHNIKTTTLKQTVAIATEKFGVDMSDKTSEIKELLVEEA